MDKVKEIEGSSTHGLQISERKSIIITGVKKIESFDNMEFFIDSIMGYILIKGEELELKKLDTFQGIVTINGRINSLNYLEESNKKVKSESLVSKLFK